LEEAVAVPASNVDLDGQCLLIDWTASESGSGPWGSSWMDQVVSPAPPLALRVL